MKNEFEKIVQKYIEEFESKHDLIFDGWVANEIGEVALFGDFFFDFNDIRRDIDFNCAKGLIFAWYDEERVNYRTFLKLKK